ncbi:MAG: type II secretion system protein [Minisyncoccia bacterium]
MKISNKEKTKLGFTLVELLIVIAIIGILSAVVLGSLNTARDKGGNTAVKANLQGIRSQAEAISGDSQNFSGTCADPNIMNAIDSAITAGSDTGATVATRCNATVGAWAVNALLKVPEGTGTYWCVDSSGAVKGESSELAGATACA